MVASACPCFVRLGALPRVHSSVRGCAREWVGGWMGGGKGSGRRRWMGGVGRETRKRQGQGRTKGRWRGKGGGG
eukprot:13932018-Alexandrium_andersonii.AAC.1